MSQDIIVCGKCNGIKDCQPGDERIFRRSACKCPDADGTIRCPRDGRTLRSYSGDGAWLECPDCDYYVERPKVA